jgi:hypothetical protein
MLASVRTASPPISIGYAPAVAINSSHERSVLLCAPVYNLMALDKRVELMNEAKDVLLGGCNCGAVRFEIVGEPMTVAACHCTTCRRQSGSAFSVNLIAPR